MSSRVLKKLHGEPELNTNEAEEILSDIESEKEKKQINNRYDLVNMLTVWCGRVLLYKVFIIAKFVFVLDFGRRMGNELGLQYNVLIKYLFIFFFVSTSIAL